MFTRRHMSALSKSAVLAPLELKSRPFSSSATSSQRADAVKMLKNGLGSAVTHAFIMSIRPTASSVRRPHVKSGQKLGSTGQNFLKVGSTDSADFSEFIHVITFFFMYQKALLLVRGLQKFKRTTVPKVQRRRPQDTVGHRCMSSSRTSSGSSELK